MKKHGLYTALDRDEIRMKANGISAGMILTILAHEMGHIVLGHVAHTSGIGLEISRNQEREADSFASSVISASPFGEYMFVGMLFWHYALMLLEGAQPAAGDDGESQTHPCSRERYENLVKANPSKAAVFGLSA